MQARWIAFGEIELEGRRYTSDVVIDAGRVEKRHKKPSKRHREEYGHTPLSAEEKIPGTAPDWSWAPAHRAPSPSCPRCGPRPSGAGSNWSRRRRRRR